MELETPLGKKLNWRKWLLRRIAPE